VGLAAAGEAVVGRLHGVVLVRWRSRRYRGARLARYAWSYVGFLIWARRVLRRIARRRAPAVVQINNVPNALMAAVAGLRRRGTGIVLDIHDPEPELFLSKFGGRVGARWGGRFLAWVERRAAAGADRVLCVHEPHREVTVAHGVSPAHLHVVLNHADERMYPRQPPRAAAPFVVYHGTVAARMGLDVVLHALRALRDQGLSVAGALWGDGDAVPPLQRLRDELGLAGVLEISGRRFQPEALVAQLGRAGLGVVPVRRDNFTDLMLPTKLLEYIRLGIPVVVTWTPTIARYVPDDAVFYVRDFSAAGVAAAVREALADPENARARATRAQRLEIGASWQAREDAYVRLIEATAPR
jgi:glycosyltransferase involved in cell wall biosynthesis